MERPVSRGYFWEHVDLRHADFYLSFDDTDFSHSELASAIFHNASLAGSNFEDTDLCGAKLASVVNYENDDLQGATADSQTTFPPNFRVKAHGIIMEH